MGPDGAQRRCGGTPPTSTEEREAREGREEVVAGA